MNIYVELLFIRDTFESTALLNLPGGSNPKPTVTKL